MQEFSVATHLLELRVLSSLLDDLASARAAGQPRFVSRTTSDSLGTSTRRAGPRSVRTLHFAHSNRIEHGHEMSKLLRGVAAGYGAKKLGGGCFSTILIFIILWWLLGHFGIFK